MLERQWTVCYIWITGNGADESVVRPLSITPDRYASLHPGSDHGCVRDQQEVSLTTGLDKQTLSICVGMIEAGANPDTLAVSLSA
jgi:hypothetical protein